MTAQLVMWLLMSQYSHLGTEEVGLADRKGLLTSHKLYSSINSEHKMKHSTNLKQKSVQ